MFDDYIEHAGQPSSSGPGLSLADQGFTGGISPFSYAQTGGLDPVEFEGFEQDAVLEGHDDQGYGEEEEAVEMEALETNLYAKHANSSETPIFSLSRVQYSPPGQILDLQVNNNILVMAVRPMSLVIIDLARADEIISVDIPKPPSSSKDAASDNAKAHEEQRIQSLFADPSGKHLIVTLTTSETYYVSCANLAAITPTQPRKPRFLRLRSPVTSVAWPPRLPGASNSTATPPSVECLVGSPNGTISTLSLPPQDDIFNLKSVSLSKSLEKDHSVLYTLPEPDVITGLAYGFWKVGGQESGRKGQSTERRVWVVATTRHRMYDFYGTTGISSNLIGKNGWGEDLFRAYRDAAPKFQEIPGDIPLSSSMLRFWTTQKPGTRSFAQRYEAVAWLTAAGVYHSPIPTAVSPESPNTVVFASPSLLNTTSNGESQAPIALALTEWHFILLLQDRLVAYSRLDETIVWDARIPVKQGEKVVGITTDPINHTFWVHSTQTLYEVVPNEEDRDVWRARLEKGDFDAALKYAKNPKQRDIIKSRQADAFFDARRFLQAAKTYAECSRSFEFVALRFVDADEKDGLRVYLAERLARLDKNDLTQRMMIATWLIEIYLSKCNTLEDVIAAEAATSDVESLRTELMLTEEDLRNFMTTYKNNVDRKVIYDLIQSHGRTEVYLFFAGLLEDDSIVIDHWITEENWLKAIDVLSRQEDIELYYRFAPILMRHRPSETVDAWLRQQEIDPRRLIPALLIDQQLRTDIVPGRQATRYLTTIIQRGDTDATIHNLLINFLATSEDPDDGPLLRYLNSAIDDPLQETPYYDLDYALRICKQRNRIQPCVYIYSKMGMYECSVDLALEKGDLELAKMNADKPEGDDELRGKLWLKIAKYVIEEQNDIKGAIQLLEESPLLKIEDILPYFPPFTSLDSIKNEICSALEAYSVRIDQLRQDMQDATDSADQIKEDIKRLETRFVTVDRDEACSRCGKMLLTRQFYVFPCQHVFHADCLIALAKEYLPSTTLRRIIYLQNEIIRLSKPLRQLQSPAARALLSTANKDDSSDTISITSRVDPTTQESLLLGGPKRLLAAGDKLRELIVPDVLASAVSVMGLGGSTSNGIASKKKGLTAADPKDQNKVEKLRSELDALVAAGCPLCEGSVTTIDKPFVTERDDDGSWDI